MWYVVKNQKGELMEGSISKNKIEAIYLACDFDELLDEIVCYQWGQSKDAEAIRKRVKRAGYSTVPVKITEIKSR